MDQENLTTEKTDGKKPNDVPMMELGPFKFRIPADPKDRKQSGVGRVGNGLR